MTYRDPDLVRAIVLYPEVGAADAHAERLLRRLREADDSRVPGLMMAHRAAVLHRNRLIARRAVATSRNGT